MMGLLILLVLVAVVAFWVIGIYNGLIRARRGYENSFAQIDVQLTRRYDLIPNLVETAKAYMKHEAGTLEAVVAARNAAVSGLKAAQAHPGDAAAMRNLAASEGQLSGALSKLMVTVEAYPDLKANQNMMQVSEELTSTENKVAFARQAFNDSVMGYNVTRDVFPNNIIAGMFNFKEAALLQIEDAVKREAVKVKFD